MSKVASYLQEHIAGEVSTNTAVLKALSTDASVLEIMPEIVIYPRVTNDIRKVARFAWQLAEKGHVLSITARGAGSDQTGAAIGKGAMVVFPAHMNRLYELEPKQKLVRVQPGLGAKALNDALALYGMSVPSLPASAAYSTIGGAVANNASGPLSGYYNDMHAWVHQLEVVLANGDVLQTKRLSKREIGKKKGLQTFEGEIYRGIDNLIEDNKELIKNLAPGRTRNNVGYSSIADVKHKDGSIDLTPLFVGSQGTLGIISEMILRAEFISMNVAVGVATFASSESARDALDKLRAINATSVEYFDASFFEQAEAKSRIYEFYKSAKEKSDVQTVVMVVFDDFNERVRLRKLKKMSKLMVGDGVTFSQANKDDANALLSVREVTGFTLSPAEKNSSGIPLFDGAYVPKERLEDFTQALTALGDSHKVELALHGRVLEDLYYARPILHLKRVGDKQKVFKLLDEFSTLVEAHGGHLIGEGGEGRIKARFAHKSLDEETKKLFASIKTIFDPYGILNPGVKQDNELKTLAAQLRDSYDTPNFSSHSLYY